MLAKEVVAAVFTSGDVVFVETAWDALLHSAYQTFHGGWLLAILNI